MRVPLDLSLKQSENIPYTISYVIRKRVQIDNLNELPKEKRPPEGILWSNDSTKLDKWLDKVLNTKNTAKAPKEEFTINIGDIE